MHLLTILFLADDTFIYVFSRIFYRLIVSGGYVANAELAILITGQIMCLIKHAQIN